MIIVRVAKASRAYAKSAPRTRSIPSFTSSSVPIWPIHLSAAAAAAVASGIFVAKAASTEEHGTTVGGHAEHISYSGKKMTKKAPADEAVVYRAIFGQSRAGDTISKFSEDYSTETHFSLTDAQQAQLVALRAHVPVFFQSSAAEMLVGNSGHAEPSELLTLENLCHGCERPSLMDVKIGTSTFTKRAKRYGKAKYDKTLLKNKATTSAQLGFYIVGLAVGGEKVVHKRFLNVPTAENIETYLIQAFIHEGKINVPALDYAIREIDRMITHFTYVNTFEVRGASVFFVIDHTTGTYQVKLIDLASVEDIGICDKEFLVGLIELRKRLAMSRP